MGYDPGKLGPKSAEISAIAALSPRSFERDSGGAFGRPTAQVSAIRVTRPHGSSEGSRTGDRTPAGIERAAIRIGLTATGRAPGALEPGRQNEQVNSHDIVLPRPPVRADYMVDQARIGTGWLGCA
jgi:hypothetical protein